MDLRPAEGADLEALYALHTAAQGASAREHFLVDWERNLPGVRVLREGARIVAAYRLDRSAGKVNLVSIDVAPSHQNRGIGTALLRKILRDAADVSVQVTLAVRRGARARGLYERLGFVVERESATHTFMAYSAKTTGPFIR